MVEEGNFLICRKFIPCLIIQTSTGVQIVNEKQRKRIQSLGYGVTEYKIERNYCIREVFCRGRHPNLNYETKSFCLDSELLESHLDIETILLIEEMLSQINLINSYLDVTERNNLLEVLGEKI